MHKGLALVGLWVTSGTLGGSPFFFSGDRLRAERANRRCFLTILDDIRRVPECHFVRISASTWHAALCTAARRPPHTPMPRRKPQPPQTPQTPQPPHPTCDPNPGVGPRTLCLEESPSHPRRPKRPSRPTPHATQILAWARARKMTAPHPMPRRKPQPPQTPQTPQPHHPTCDPNPSVSGSNSLGPTRANSPAAV